MAGSPLIAEVRFHQTAPQEFSSCRHHNETLQELQILCIVTTNEGSKQQGLIARWNSYRSHLIMFVLIPFSDFRLWTSFSNIKVFFLTLFSFLTHEQDEVVLERIILCNCRFKKVRFLLFINSYLDVSFLRKYISLYLHDTCLQGTKWPLIVLLP